MEEKGGGGKGVHCSLLSYNPELLLGTPVFSAEAHSFFAGGNRESWREGITGVPGFLSSCTSKYKVKKNNAGRATEAKLLTGQ